MKKVLLSSMAIVALALASCGKSACDCMTEIDKLQDQAYDAAGKGDAEEAAKLAEEAQALLDGDCKEFTAEDYEACE